MNDRMSFKAERSHRIQDWDPPTSVAFPGWAWPDVGTQPGLVNAWFSWLNADAHLPDGVTYSRTSQIHN